MNPEDLDRQWMEAPRPVKSKPEAGKGKPGEAVKGKQQQLHKQSSLEGANSSASASSSSHEGPADPPLDPLDHAAAAGMVFFRAHSLSLFFHTTTCRAAHTSSNRLLSHVPGTSKGLVHTAIASLMCAAMQVCRVSD